MIAYLLKMSISNNNNRYYKMIQRNDIFEIEYGRVGATPIKLKRPMSLWKETYEKHIAEGYIDRTEYMTILNEEGEFKPIENKYVDDLVKFLLDRCNEVINTNYSVSYSEVSKKMIEEAQDLIYRISQNPTKENALKLLPELFVVIPRKMKDVSTCLPQSDSAIPLILQNEQELLDVMASKVVSAKNKADRKKTILEANNIDISLVTSQPEMDKIKECMGTSQSHFVRVFRVYNKRTDKAFDDYISKHHIRERDIHFYYHGSKNINYWSLITQGQKLNPKAPITGKMFGHGLYYANLARKSINYTSLKGSYWAKGRESRAYLAVFKVAYNNPLSVQKHQSWMCNIRTKADINNHDALFAHGGIDLINDEVIIYDENQVTLRYLIELK